MDGPGSTADIDRRIAGRLDDLETRYTPGRRLAIEVLAGARGPLSTSELHARLEGSVPLSSLYRTVSVLDEAGVVTRSHDADGIATYELAEWLLGHHHHLVCVQCGAAEDIDLTPELEDRVREVAEAAGRAAGFEITGHSLDLEGRCSRCRTH